LHAAWHSVVHAAGAGAGAGRASVPATALSATTQLSRAFHVFTSAALGCQKTWVQWLIIKAEGGAALLLLLLLLLHSCVLT
jgi:hypothetical protein